MLLPMHESTYPKFIEEAASGYAEDNVASGRWPAQDALQMARDETLRLLPEGLATPDNHFFEIRETADGPVAGFLWAAAMARGSRKVAFIYQLHVFAPFRRRGLARSALLDFEQVATGLGYHGVGLNVFASNTGAQALYRSVGFVDLAINMQKLLTPAAAPV